MGRKSKSRRKSRPAYVRPGRFAAFQPFWIAGPAILFACWSVISAWQYGARNAGIDFYQMWAASQVQGRADIANLYDAETGLRLGKEFIQRASEAGDPDLLLVAKYWGVLESISSPLLYALFKVLPTRDYLIAFDLYRTICLAALVAALSILGYLVRLTVAQTAIAIGLCSRLFEPVLSDIRVGNVNQLELLAVTISVYFLLGHHRWQRILGAALVAATTVFKPNVFLVALAVVLLPLSRREWRRVSESLAGLGIGSCLALAVGAFSARSTFVWSQWLRRVRSFPEEILARDGNYSFQRLVESRFHFVGPGVMALTVVIILVACQLWGSRRSELTRTRQLLLLTGALLGSLLTLNLVWLHYFVLCIPSMMLLMSPRFGMSTRILAVGCFVLIAGLPNEALHVDVRIEMLEMLAGAVVLFGLTMWHLARSSPQGADT